MGLPRTRAGGHPQQRSPSRRCDLAPTPRGGGNTVIPAQAGIHFVVIPAKPVLSRVGWALAHAVIPAQAGIHFVVIPAKAGIHCFCHSERSAESPAPASPAPIRIGRKESQPSISKIRHLFDGVNRKLKISKIRLRRSQSPTPAGQPPKSGLRGKEKGCEGTLTALLPDMRL